MMHCGVKIFKLLKNYVKLFFCIAFIILLTGVSSPVQQYGEKQKVNVNYKFSMDLLRRLNRNVPQNNYIVSPLGIVNNLSILYLGSTGKTKEQIAKLLTTSSKPIEFLNRQKKRMNILVKAAEKDKIDLKYANILLADNTYCLLKDSFKEKLENSDFCKLETVKYKTVGQTIKRINEWCQNNTNNRISNIIHPEDIKSKSSPGQINEPFFTLLSAIYFKGDWASRFCKNTNHKFPFNHKVGAPAEMIYMMEQYNTLEYAESKNVKILKMYFEGNDFFILLVLPKKIMSAEQLLAQITPEEIQKTSSYLSLHSVDVRMPKFKIQDGLKLKTIMKDLGFVEMNNFDSMFVRSFNAVNVYLDTMKQKNYFAVDEKGAEAASVAYTQSFSVGCAAGEPRFPYATFFMDRPFLFFLQHEGHKSSTVLFAGCYAKPPKAAAYDLSKTQNLDCNIPVLPCDEKSKVSSKSYIIID